jgi:hypothetical protein
MTLKYLTIDNYYHEIKFIRSNLYKNFICFLQI